MLKKINLTIIAFFVMLLLPRTVKAAVVNTEMVISPTLSDWVYDEGKEKIYAISNSAKSFYIIDMATLEIEYTIGFSSNPNHLIIDGNVAYIALSSKNEIRRIEVNAGKELTTITVKNKPYYLAKNGDKLYYSYGDVYEYDLKTNTEKKLEGSGDSQVKFVIDKKNNLLYTGRYTNYETKLTYFDLESEEVKAQTVYRPAYGAGSPKGNMMLYENTLYYADRDFSPEDPKKFGGDYGNDAIMDIEGQVVFGLKGVYNRNSHVQIGTYSKEATLVTATKNTILLFSKKDGKIYKYRSNESITENNVISVLGGAKTEQVVKQQKADRVCNNLHNLSMKSELTKWILDEENTMLYAISEKDKALFFLDSNTMDVKDSLVFKAAPTDVSLYKGQLYITLHWANQIVVVDVKTKKISKTVYTMVDPYRLEIDLDRIYYASERYKNGLYMYDLANDTDQLIYYKFADLYGLSMAVNRADHILYLGESGSSSSDVFYFDMVTNTLLQKNPEEDLSDFAYADRRILFDGENVYFEQYALDKKDPRRVIGCYGTPSKDEKLLFVKNELAFTTKGIYNRDSFELVESLDGKNSLYELSKDGVLFSYDKTAKQVVRSKKDYIASITFDSMGGSEVSKKLADLSEPILAPQNPWKSNYVFIGWYKDKEYTIPWDFQYDVVDGDMTLYARWIDRAGTPLNVKAQAGAFNQIKVSWSEVADATFYYVTRATSVNGVYHFVGESSSTVYVDTMVEPGITYYYKVSTFVVYEGNVACGDDSKACSARTSIGAILSVGEKSNLTKAVEITWSKVAGATGYEIYLSEKQNSGYRLVSTKTGTSVTVGGLKENTSYYFKVRAYRIVSGKRVYGGFSSIKTAKTAKPIPKPAKPSLVSVKKTSKNSTKVTWKKVSKASGYEVYRATSKNGKYKRVKTLSGVSYTDKKLARKKTYYYKVRAYKIVNKKKIYGSYSTIKAVKL